MANRGYNPAFGGIKWAIGAIGFALLMTVLSWRALDAPFARGTNDWTLLFGETASVFFLIVLFRVFKRHLERLVLVLCIAEFVLSGFGQLVTLSQHSVSTLRFDKLVIWLIVLCICIGLLYADRKKGYGETSG
jgi:hypothetical protein